MRSTLMALATTMALGGAAAADDTHGPASSGPCPCLTEAGTNAGRMADLLRRLDPVRGTMIPLAGPTVALAQYGGGAGAPTGASGTTMGGEGSPGGLGIPGQTNNPGTGATGGTGTNPGLPGPGTGATGTGTGGF